jgi:hypothetical protein
LDDLPFNKATEEVFYTSTSTPEWNESFLMLLPQNPTKWNTSGTPVVVAPTTESYVQLVYRWENRDAIGAIIDEIGFSDASNHPDYADSQCEKDGYTGPLFVKVGYSYSPEWVKGKGYQYDIPIPGSTGGRLINNKLIDDKGNETDLTVPGISVPEVIIPSDDFIHLVPKVTEWANETHKPIEQ